MNSVKYKNIEYKMKSGTDDAKSEKRRMQRNKNEEKAQVHSLRSLPKPKI
jgi:hypothetical protein